MSREARLEGGQGDGERVGAGEGQGEGVDEAVELPLLPPIGEGQRRGQFYLT